MCCAWLVWGRGGRRSSACQCCGLRLPGRLRRATLLRGVYVALPVWRTLASDLLNPPRSGLHITKQDLHRQSMYIRTSRTPSSKAQAAATVPLPRVVFILILLITSHSPHVAPKSVSGEMFPAGCLKLWTSVDDYVIIDSGDGHRARSLASCRACVFPCRPWPRATAVERRVDPRHASLSYAAPSGARSAPCSPKRQVWYAFPVLSALPLAALVEPLPPRLPCFSSCTRAPLVWACWR